MIPQYSFQGTARIYHLKQNELLNWAIKIAGRYMGKNNAEAYGKRNSTEGAVLVRIKPKKIIIAAKDTAEWE
jgi:hypothetical protein